MRRTLSISMCCSVPARAARAASGSSPASPSPPRSMPYCARSARPAPPRPLLPQQQTPLTSQPLPERRLVLPVRASAPCSTESSSPP
jgi:hypothetical protein